MPPLPRQTFSCLRVDENHISLVDGRGCSVVHPVLSPGISCRRANARERIAKSLAALADSPRIGHPIGKSEQREFSISRTPFSLIYRVMEDRIEILRLWDGRANPDRLTAPDEELD